MIPSSTPTPAEASSPAEAPVAIPAFCRKAQYLLYGVLALFVLAVALNLNGSSSSIWGQKRSDEPQFPETRSGLLLAEPRPVRSDEWLVVTLATLSQARSLPSFPTTSPSYGPGKVPLIMSLPARHYTMIFRPALWAYFVAPFDYAFSWHWNFKIFALFASLFTLFWVLTHGNFALSLSGALCVQFAGFTQWWFSSPAMLPEMLTAWSLGLVAAIHLFHPTSRRVLHILLLCSCLISFFLCCYPPFEIPLVYLGLFILVGYAWQLSLPIKKGLYSMGAGVILATLLLIPWFLECRPTLEIVSQTVYPGHRLTVGGLLPINRLFSGLFTFLLDENNCPKSLLNVCEASNFYPIWWLPILLGCATFLQKLRSRENMLHLWSWLRENGILVSLVLYILFLTYFAIAPLPQWFCKITLLSRCTEQRNLLTLGLAGTILTILSLAHRPFDTQNIKTRHFIAFFWSAAVLAFLLFCRGSMPEFLVPWRIAAFEGFAIALAAIYLYAGSARFHLIFPASLVAAHVLVNPLCVGLPELTQSKALKHVQAMIEKDPSALWAGYETLLGIELVKACGGNVINGLRVVPDLDKLHQLDPDKTYDSYYNRYVHFLLGYRKPSDLPTFRLVDDVYCIVDIHPWRLAKAYPGLKYIMTPERQSQEASKGLKLVAGLPDNNLWIYQITQNPDSQ